MKHSRTGATLVIVLLATVTLFGYTTRWELGPWREAMAASTPVRTSTPTYTPTPSAAPFSRSALLASLQRQLDFGLGGGGGGVLAWQCREAVKNYHGSLPAVLNGERQLANSRSGSICLVGLEPAGPLQVKLTGADGKVLGSAEFSIAQRYDDGATLNQTQPTKIEDAGELAKEPGMPVIVALNIWLPPDLKSSAWRVEAQSGGRKASGLFQPAWPKELPVLYLNSKSYNPFRRPFPAYSGVVDWSDQAQIKPDQTVKFNGLNLPANQALPLAMYQLRPGLPAELSAFDIVNTNPTGGLEYSLSIGEWMPPGLYHLTIVTNLKDETPYAGPFLGVYADTCPGAPDSSLLNGNTIEINPDLPSPNNIRNVPGKAGKIIGKLVAGETALILEDFRCVNQMVWWKIRSSSGIVGWTAEGQGKDRFLVPAW